MTFIKGLLQHPILKIALPAIVSNITIPLLGLVDVAIVGRLGAAAYIGAIAVGGSIFSMIYWIFGFLRMGTSGISAQAYGQKDENELQRVLLRAMTTAQGLALLLIFLQHPILELALHLIPASPGVATLARKYFDILIWGAPATLGLYAFNGWFIGRQNSRIPMYIALAQNLVNIGVSIFLVLVVHLKVEGVAIGTLVAQYTGFVWAIVFWLKHYRRESKTTHWRDSLQKEAYLRFMRINRDIFFRTLCLVAVSLYFTSSGASKGDTILAVNTLLMQLFTLFSYFMDGFAYAGEALTGKHVGAKDSQSLHRTIRALFQWGTAVAVIFTLLYMVADRYFLYLLTDNRPVLRLAFEYRYWTWLIPLAGYAAFLWDGVFIGATASRAMLISMTVASIVFFSVHFLLQTLLGNHALWLAFISYLFVRGLIQGLMAGKVVYS